MTGLEVLREEMLKAGATRQQVESKTVALVISSLTHMDYQVLFDLEKDIKEAKLGIYKHPLAPPIILLWQERIVL